MFELFVALGLGVVSVLGILYMIVRQDRYCERIKDYYDDDSGGIVH
jgi:hypothetical protein